MRKLVVEVTDREYAIIAKCADMAGAGETPAQFLHRAGVEGIVRGHDGYLETATPAAKPARSS